ncbi:alpha-glucosidase/alpha-galactosidase [uncultured Devosia sp.]|uniref:alpha-glucosidase/alpha-galactosidase n=1 Tax=uncultured Devosia sp. TaxID=211434 RepID=UPI0035C987D5
MTKIAMIGAGSVVFVKKLLADILAKPELHDATIALHDIDAERLETAGMMARWTAGQLGANPVVEEHADRRSAIAGADFVINMVLIGGVDAVRKDFEIPAKFGLKQTIGDTVGIGGIFRGLRTIPFMMELCQDMTELCPDAYLLNYTNPMSIVTWAVYKAYPKIKSVGLCHNVQHTAENLADYLGVEMDRLSFDCAGINHMTWFLRLEVDGKDAYPALRAAMQNPEIFAKDRVRFELFRQLGWFVSESSRHCSEYVPYFLRDAGETARFALPVNDSVRIGDEKILRYKRDRQRLQNGEGFEFEKSVEYGAEIIHAVVTNEPTLIYGNIENKGHITNLPDGACVEVPVVVDRNGFRGCYAGALPPELAAHCAPHVFVQDLTVRAALEGNRDRVYRAAMLDRHAPSVLTIPQIRQMVDELLIAHGDAMPDGVRVTQDLRAAS